MSAIFLSASIPTAGRGNYYETANPFLIQCAVRELVMAVIDTHNIVWGGHPAITPMIWSICEDIGVDYSSSVVLYQSLYFQDHYPEENNRFQNVIHTEAVPDDKEASLKIMRKEMLSRDDLVAAVFIGGMDGIEVEYDMFKQFHSDAKTLFVAAPGGAALELARQLGEVSSEEFKDIDFAQLFHKKLSAEELEHQPEVGTSMF